MNRFLALMIAAAASALIAGGAQAQAVGTVGMIGNWYSFNGPAVNIPYNPPVIPCTPGIGGACPKKFSPITGTNYNQPSFGILAAGTVMGGVNIGDSFEIKPDSFNQNVGSQFGPIPYNFAVQQINTRFTFKAPPTSRLVSPAANTRKFAQNAWSLPGNGQTGRVLADTTVVSAAGKTTVTYKAGTNAFGGTMHMLLRGPGELYLNGAIFGSASFPLSLQPMVGIQPIGSSVTPSPWRTRPAGIGWDLTAMGTQLAGVVRGGAAFAAPCSVQVPPGPAGCELVLNTGFADVFPLSTATSIIHGFPFTTGTVMVGFVGTVAGGPGTFTLTGNGYDTTTVGGIRNIAMVAGSYQVRTDDTGVSYTPTMAIVELSFAPEPYAGIALAGGSVVLGLLHLLNRRRQKRS